MPGCTVGGIWGSPQDEVGTQGDELLRVCEREAGLDDLLCQGLPRRGARKMRGSVRGHGQLRPGSGSDS